MIKAERIFAGMLAVFLLLGSFFPVPLVWAQGSGGQAYVLYDAPARYGSDYPMVTALLEHLGHFELQCETDAVEDWQADKIAAADVVVVVGLRDTRLPEELLAALTGARKVIWFEKNIEQLAAYRQWDDFSLQGTMSGWSYVKDTEERYFPDWLRVVIARPGAGSRVVATIHDISASEPLAWQRDNICYCGLLETDPVFMVTLGNVLHQFLGSQHPPVQQVLLRIEDVSPLTDPKAVRKVLEAVRRYHIPFAIGVIPVGIGADGKRVAMHESPELTAVLQDAQADGASIIMHGYTHQNEFSPKTGEGYEFWNARDDKPIDNIEAFTAERLEAGIAELVRCGLIPVAFEPPHYAMSSGAYRELSRFFNIFSGQVQISDKTEAISLTMPYTTKSPYLNGMLVLPENMGYYDGGREHDMAAMLKSSEQIQDVPDAFAGFFYHGYLAPDILPSIIEHVRAQGYEFYDIRQQDIRVQSSQIEITGSHGDIQVHVAKELQDAWGDAPLQENTMEKVGSVHIIVLVLLIAALLFIIVRLQLNARKKYESEPLDGPATKK